MGFSKVLSAYSLHPHRTPQSVTPSAAYTISCKPHSELFDCSHFSNISPIWQGKFTKKVTFVGLNKEQSKESVKDVKSIHGHMCF
jgi:hypothetical protein